MTELGDGDGGVEVMKLKVTELKDQAEELGVTGSRDAGMGQRWSWRWQSSGIDMMGLEMVDFGDQAEELGVMGLVMR